MSPAVIHHAVLEAIGYRAWRVKWCWAIWPIELISCPWDDPTITTLDGQIYSHGGEYPDLTLDLMHEAEETLTDEQWELYESYIWDTSKTIVENGRRLVSATAAQRARAFLKTIGKWTDQPNA